jgi:aryl-alcohol dehydrogenase-like predicted oxidoreductase
MDTGQQTSSRAKRLPERFDLSQTGNQRKLDAVEQLAELAEETGITLIELAIAFVLTPWRSPQRSSGRERWSSEKAS